MLAGLSHKSLPDQPLAYKFLRELALLFPFFKALLVTFGIEIA